MEELNKEPQHQSFPGEIWTCKCVKAVIEEFFTVDYDPTQVRRILKKEGWSRQKPQKKARQQSAESVQ